MQVQILNPEPQTLRSLNLIALLRHGERSPSLIPFHVGVQKVTLTPFVQQGFGLTLLIFNPCSNFDLVMWYVGCKLGIALLITPEPSKIPRPEPHKFNSLEVCSGSGDGPSGPGVRVFVA